MSMTRPTTEQMTHEGQLLSDVLWPMVTPEGFGAVGDGVADDTLALRAAFDYAVPLKRTVLLRGSYRVTGYIQQRVQRPSGELHIICDGNVSITVDPASASFDYLLACQIGGPTNMSITGASLKIDCSLKAAEAIFLYNNDTVTGGTVNLECPITILNCRQNRTTGVNLNASGITCVGLWETVNISNAAVIQVERAGDGVCRGITAGVGDNGHCSIRNPYIKNVLHGPLPFDKDADGIGVAGYVVPGNNASGTYRSGTFIIDGGTFIDCQSRSIKVQASNCTVIAPRILHKDVLVQVSAVDIDFQHGNGTLIAPSFEYRLNGGVSPLAGSSYRAVAAWQPLSDAGSAFVCRDTKIVSDHAMPFAVFNLFPGINFSGMAPAQSGSFLIDGVQFCGAGGFAGDINPRSIVEIPNITDYVLSMAGTVDVTVRNVTGNFTGAPVAYTGYSGGADAAIAAKLRVEVTGVRSMVGTAKPPFRWNAQTRIPKLDKFLFRDNANIETHFTSTANFLSEFDFATLEVGNVFTMNIPSCTVANAPPWTSVDHNALVEVIALGQNTVTKVIRVTTWDDNATSKRFKTFITEDNAANWYQLNAMAPRTKSSDFTVGATEDILINDKSGSACTVTMPDPALYQGRSILIKTIQAQQVNSASSNIVPLAGGAAGTAILTNTAGKWAQLVSNGTNWVIMSAN